MLAGIDLSSNNDIDDATWDALAAEGCAFVVARAVMGTGTDMRCGEHLLAGSRRGMALAIYAYLRGDRTADEQAAALLREAARYEPHVGPLGLAIDLEDRAGKVGQPKPPPWPRAAYADIALATVDLVSAASCRPVIVYGSPSFLGEMFKAAPEAMTSLALRCPLWLADWTAPWDLPRPWTAYVLHQTGQRDGLDRDEFDGDVDDLRRVFGLDVRDTPIGGEPLPGPA